MIAVLIFFAGMAMLSLVHEVGHAAAASMLRLHITDVCIGLGPPLLVFHRGGIRISLAPLPLGGFVRVAELSEESDERPAVADRFSGVSAIKRLTVIIAGPVANLLFATALAFAATLSMGIDTGHSSGLRVVRADDGPTLAGLATGDVVVQINGRTVRDLPSLSQSLETVDANGNANVTVSRRGETRQIILPRSRGRGGTWGLGAVYTAEPELRHVGPVAAASYALSAPLREAFAMAAHAMDALKSPRTSSHRPLGVVALADRVYTTRTWTVRRVLTLATSLSVAMGIFNLLPFPVLDGGRLCIEAAQALARRRLPTRVLIAIQAVGGLLLLTAWLALTAFEIYRL